MWPVILMLSLLVAQYTRKIIQWIVMQLRTYFGSSHLFLWPYVSPFIFLLSMLTVFCIEHILGKTRICRILAFSNAHHRSHAWVWAWHLEECLYTFTMSHGVCGWRSQTYHGSKVGEFISNMPQINVAKQILGHSSIWLRFNMKNLVQSLKAEEGDGQWLWGYVAGN